MRVVITGAGGFLGWEAPGDCARELFGEGRELPQEPPNWLHGILSDWA